MKIKKRKMEEYATPPTPPKTITPSKPKKPIPTK